MDDRWVSIKEISEYLGARRETIYKWIEEKNMPAHQIGRCWKFKISDVDQWIKSGNSAPDPVHRTTGEKK